jgi:hypothetical protein
MNIDSCRVGKGVGTAFPCWYGLSYAVPTRSYVTARLMTRGHGVREGMSSGEVVPSPLPTLRRLREPS